MEEQETRWERTQKALPLVAVAAVLIFAAYVGVVKFGHRTQTTEVAETAPAASKATTPADCMGWITRADMALALTPETLTSEGITFGALMVCHHTIAKAVTLRVIVQGEYADIPMDVDPAPESFATMAQFAMPSLPIGYYEVQFLIDGRVVAHTWMEIQPATKTGPQ